ncbi:MAG: hypothetical protein ACK5LL_03725 [Suipraeoptans sp.]
MKSILTSTFRVALLAMIISVGVMGAACAQVTSDNSCRRINEVVSDDLMKQGQLSRDSVVLYIPAKDNNQAFQQAQNLCIRLNAEMTEKSSNSTTYTLADDTGKITIIDFKKEKNVFTVVFLKVNCHDLLIKEIRFISLKAYVDLEKLVHERQKSNNNRR